MAVGCPNFGCQNSMKRFKFVKVQKYIMITQTICVCFLVACLQVCKLYSFDRCRRSFGEKHTLESPFVFFDIVDMNHHENIVELTAETFKIAFLQMLLFAKQHP